MVAERVVKIAELSTDGNVWGYAFFEELEWRSITDQGSSYEVRVDWVRVRLHDHQILASGENYFDCRLIAEVADKNGQMRVDSTLLTVVWLTGENANAVASTYFQYLEYASVMKDEQREKLLRQSGWREEDN